ncbi:MAG: hypothetical protein ACJ79S_17340 [Gemmatimonadaceae bacterium]
MTATMRPAVDGDILGRPIGEISAVQFLDLLQQVRLSPDVMALLPDKKKYELWVDEGGVAKLPIGVLLEKLRIEKKKLELEKRLIVEGIPKRIVEREIDPGELIDPAVREGLVQEIVGEVMKRIGQ